jgi:uncharacterized protein with NAD-binding domain and iron-sulfur cluster
VAGSRRRRVAIFGAGVAGLTAAHELAERGYSVVVYENRTAPGGKARSMPVPDSARDGRLPLPGEHGFRFFPGFYRHIPDTMGRIPYKGGTVFDNLVPASRITVAREGSREIVIPAHLPLSPSDIGLFLNAVFRSHTGLTVMDVVHFTERLAALLAGCRQRRFAEFEEQSWWDFCGAADAGRSEAYRKFLGKGLTRTLVAARATEMSARTGGLILLQLLSDLTRVGHHVDRVLCGPTSDVWIKPWVHYLKREKGVEFRFDSRVTYVHCSGRQITGITVRTPASTKARSQIDFVPADYYVAAVPVEIMCQALVNDDMKEADPGLADLDNLETRWMNGVMFYLRADVPLEHGHTIYIDSDWALTSISQHQFWPGVDFSRLGDGTVRGILSVDVSDWTAESRELKKAAMDCGPDEFVTEVWRQLKAHLNDDALPDLVDGNKVRSFVDPDIEWPNPDGVCGNLEPLLINTPGSWKWRPNAVTAIENLFLAGDYVRTNTDLATMEGANEAARRAVNGILDADGSLEPRGEVWDLRDPRLLAPVRATDRAWLEVRPHLHGVGA